MKSRSRRWLISATLATLSGCAGLSAIRAAQEDLPARQAEADIEVEFWLDAPPGNDMVTIYGEGSSALARDIVDTLQIRDPRFEDYPADFFFENSTEIRDAGRARMVVREGSAWTFRFDASGLRQALANAGHSRFDLTLCTPMVETRPEGSRPPDLDYNDYGCLSWNAGEEDTALTIGADLIPNEAHWRIFLGFVIGWNALYILVALAVGRTMRRDVRRRGGVAIAGIIFGTVGTLFVAGLSAMISFFSGPADNLALSRDLTSAGYGMAIFLPSAGVFIPLMVFVLTLVWGRPWRAGHDRWSAHAGTSFGPPTVPPG